MKRIQLFLITSVLLVLSTKVIGQKTNDLKEDNLKGKVKSVKEIRFKKFDSLGQIQRQDTFRYLLVDYNIMGNYIEGHSFGSNLKIETKTFYSYDSNDNIIKLNYINPWKVINKNDIYKYDKNGKLIELITYKDSSTKYNYKEIFKYDSNGYLIEQTKYSEWDIFDSKSTYTYNSNGQKIEINHYEIADILDYKQIIKYDNNGNQVEWLFDHGDSNEYVFGHITNDSIQNSRVTFKYNSNNKLIEKSEYPNNYRLNNKFTIKYDSNGNPFETVVYNSEGSIKYKFTEKYKYDFKNNWIECVELKDNKIHLLIERKIEYY